MIQEQERPVARPWLCFCSVKASEGISDMALSTILIVILILLLIGAIPAWPHSRAWGYGPSGLLGALLLVVLVLALLQVF